MHNSTWFHLKSKVSLENSYLRLKLRYWCRTAIILAFAFVINYSISHWFLESAPFNLLCLTALLLVLITSNKTHLENAVKFSIVLPQLFIYAFLCLLLYWRSSNWGLISFILFCPYVHCMYFYICKWRECNTQGLADHKVKSKHFSAYLNTNASLPVHTRQFTNTYIHTYLHTRM